MDEITAKLEQINLTPETPPTPDKHKAPRPPSADEAWIHKRLVEDCEGILFVGKSVNRSLPIAIAAMRGSWDNIWASSLGETCQWDMLTPEGLAPMEQILEAARKRAKDNADLIEKRFFWRPEYDNDIRKDPEWKPEQLVNKLINNLSSASISDIELRFSVALDATKLHLPVNRQLLCPWSDSGKSESSSLILQFLASAAEVQIPGDAIFLGLTANLDYCDDYELPAVLEHAESLDYDLCPVDRCCIRRAIDLGYLHKKPGNWRIDGKLLHYPETYVFVKRDAKEATRSESSSRMPVSGAGAQEVGGAETASVAAAGVDELEK
ncbi:hypothetical protein C8F01DRAFT_1231718 [Mycena amicta]|nr:hypothetical protein C8F01DRAFT_1231718 [Mycena amicta]